MPETPEQDFASSESEKDDSEEIMPNERQVMSTNPELSLMESVREMRKLMTLECVNTNWLTIPFEIMNPKKMCAVNQFVHIVDHLGVEYNSHANELVLVSCGTTVPDHFRWMIQCVSTVIIWKCFVCDFVVQYFVLQINNAASIKSSFIPVQGLTRGINVAGKSKKKFDTIGIERLIHVYKDQSDMFETYFIATLETQFDFKTRCNKFHQSSTSHAFARVSNVVMHWGIIPVEYRDKANQRKLFQILRVIPQPGFNLLEFIRKQYFEKRNDTKNRDVSKINETCNLLQQVINFEADVNYGMKGVWDSSMPNPWTVNDSCSATSIDRLLSPFTVLRRILQHIKGGYCGTTKTDQSSSFVQATLIIDGFPSLADAETASCVLKMYDDAQELYLRSLMFYNQIYAKTMLHYCENPAVELIANTVLCENTTNMNFLPSKLNMVFCLENFRENDQITIPKLGLAMFDMFLFFETSCLLGSMNQLDFIVAHVGEFMTTQIVTVSEIMKKYKSNSDSASLEDFPKAGLLKSARDTFKRNLNKLLSQQEEKNVVTLEVATFYENYLLLQFNATKNGIMMDAWMSERVYRGGLLLEQLVGQHDPCANVKAALQWAFEFRSTTNTMGNQLIHSPCGHTWHRLNLALCKLNESIKANPMNLTLIWGMLKGDVLTFMGLHNQTWRWMMYCMQVAPCWGHLRTLTEDGHAARSECALTAKPNSVGLNEVVIKTANYCLCDLLGYIVNMSAEDIRVLKLDKVDRKTRVSIESGHSCEFANNQQTFAWKFYAGCSNRRGTSFV